MNIYEAPANLDRNMKPVSFYFIFESTEERDRAKIVFQQILEDDKKNGIYQLPAGPDYWLSTKPHTLEAEFNNFLDDGNPDKSKVGLEVSFIRTPEYFHSPESLKAFIIDQFSLRGLKLKENGGATEVYEVVDGVPQ